MGDKGTVEREVQPLSHGARERTHKLRYGLRHEVREWRRPMLNGGEPLGMV